ncbi:hypothetical protein RFI_36755 [Reticulomyxa filosa]|uniref:Uncharacterized protein n=1 Tax=Reticulomyxa filosa TaxID=46433 RepID=X6LHR2_RETFI|nr:hypothetical protein RFI_36755 [Reticulomyxa filosa]|eukprot:ETO00682.1 hypothetical protein RFI_36755 [Reticulomyxa filosa]
MAQAPTTTENDATARFGKIKKMGIVSQANFFVNVWWSDLAENDKYKDTVALSWCIAKLSFFSSGVLALEYLKEGKEEGEILFLLKVYNLHWISSACQCTKTIQLCNVLQQLEQQNEIVKEAFGGSSDKSTMKQKFTGLNLTLLRYGFHFFFEKGKSRFHFVGRRQKKKISKRGIKNVLNFGM